MTFYKMVATGNDFVVMDGREMSLDPSHISDLAKDLCRRRLSVGADGLIVIDNGPPGYDFSWHFYNADGSRAEMCGNGARCAAYLFWLLEGKKKVRFLTDAGPVEAEVMDDKTVSVLMGEPEGLRRDIKVGSFLGHFVRVGVPHFVVFVDDIDRVDVDGVGRFIRFSDEFSPDGTNVNFVKVSGDSAISVRTYERGVEGETLACGTGACASFYVSRALGFLSGDACDVTTKGGTLRIAIKNGLLHLRGGVKLVYEGKILEENHD